jgi:hypothetical protein
MEDAGEFMVGRELKFSLVRGQFAICQLPAGTSIPEWATGGELFSISGTAEELSIVCEAELVPVGVRAQGPFVCLKLEGPFPLTQTGVLSAFVQPLSDAGIPIFAVSTYDTDYVLIPQEFVDRATGVLQTAGHPSV